MEAKKKEKKGSREGKESRREEKKIKITNDKICIDQSLKRDIYDLAYLTVNIFKIH